MLQRNATQRNTTQRNATQHNTTQRNATQHNATQRNATQRNATQRNATQRNATQRNATQRNATQHNATQRNATQRNATQRNNISSVTRSVVRMSGAATCIEYITVVSHVQCRLRLQHVVMEDHRISMCKHIWQTAISPHTHIQHTDNPFRA